ncbi:TPA: P2 family phage major capsid protein [Escherichia coli]|nr:P2 family phage major capsid protein [Escherichia coli]
MKTSSELKAYVSSLLTRKKQGVTKEVGEKIDQEIEKLGLLIDELETHSDDRRFQSHSGDSEKSTQYYTKETHTMTAVSDPHYCGDDSFREESSTRESAFAERNRRETESLIRLVEIFAQTSIENTGFFNGKSITIRPESNDASPVPVRSLALADSWSTDFLEKINIIRLEDQAVEVGSINTGSIASTSGIRHERTRDPSVMARRLYRLEQVNADTSINYLTLSSAVSSAQNDEFVDKALKAVERRKLLDLMLIGFNGTHHAVISDPHTYPNREDCLRGWLSAWKDEAPAQVISGLSVSEADQCGRIVKAGDYANLDALVIDAYQTMIDERFWTGLVALCSHDLLHRKHQPLINNLSASGTPNTEILVNQEVYKNPQLGGLPAVVVPFIPDNAIIVTSLSNLSYYWQKGSWRKSVYHEPKFSRIAFYDSWRACYAVEDYLSGCVIDDILLP